MTTWDAALVDPDQALAAPRTLLAGRYEIAGLLGTGGMGTVYRAFDRELEEDVALKVLRRDFVGDPVTLERFRREVKLARRVTHPNVARVYDIGEHEGVRFLTMELVEGESLAARLARDIAMAPASAVAIALAVCEGLTAAHAAGVVHRDLKPDNVMLGAGRVVLTDFGIARLTGLASSRTQGLIVGTPEYMAPEQVDAREDIDGRSDIYALGVMLFEMLTGEAPWKGESPIAIASRRLVTEPPDPSNIVEMPAALSALVLRCMARDRAMRFSTAAEVQTALRACGRLNSDRPLPLGLLPTQPPAAPIARTPRNARSVILLPAKNTGSPEDAHFVRTFGDALSEALSAQLAITVHTESVRSGTERDVRARGRELGAEAVVTPSLRVTADRGLRAAVRVVSVAEGLQLWAGRIDRPVGELFDLVADCADHVASALGVLPPARPARDPDDPEVVDLLARAHAEGVLAESGANDRAVAHLERAYVLRPPSFRVLSAYAAALARRVEEGEGIVEEALEAKSMAEQALALAPEAIEPRVTIARVQLELGEPATSAAQLGLRVDPGHALAQRTLGLLLADAGRLDAAVVHLARAARLGDARSRYDEARVRALAGDPGAAESVLDADRGPRGRDYFIVAARLAAWRRNAARLGELSESLRSKPVSRRDALLSYLSMTTMDAASICQRLQDQARTSGDVPRRRALWFCMAAEVAAFAGDVPRSLSFLASAIGSSLSDVPWLERSPLLDSVRQHPGFPPILAAARARAAPALGALGALGVQEASR